jgi:hypothetical protein
MVHALSAKPADQPAGVLDEDTTMSAMLNDYKVDFLREETIESLARQCRIAAALKMLRTLTLSIL